MNTGVGKGAPVASMQNLPCYFLLIIQVAAVASRVIMPASVVMDGRDNGPAMTGKRQA
jgi:hypothetical protein